MHVLPCARADVPPFRISETVGQIALKFGMWLETHQLGVLHNPIRVGYSSTCAREHPVSVPLERLDGLRWHLVCG